MRCPKCGHDNPGDIMFCEECDHQLSRPFKPKSSVPPLYLAAIALILGAISVIFALVLDNGWYIPVGAGGVGLFLSTYALSVIRFSPMENKTVPMVITMSATALSVVGFVLGITMI
jgi:predicted nucleic acid-binding Zn ribbon protein